MLPNTSFVTVGKAQVARTPGLAPITTPRAVDRDNLATKQRAGKSPSYKDATSLQPRNSTRLQGSRPAPERGAPPKNLQDSAPQAVNLTRRNQNQPRSH